MARIPVHTIEDAPAGARPLLAEMVPARCGEGA
jgi:hypothetical protein